MTVLTSGNQRVKEARKLSRRSVRTERRLFLAEGWKAVAEAATVPGCLVEVFATPAAAEEHAALLGGLPDVVVHLVEERAAESLSGAVSPQGLVAVCRFLDRPLEAVLSGRTVVICADVRDPGNAGTIIRTADAAGAGAVVLAGHSVDPYNDKTVRATVGSLFHVPLCTEVTPAEAITAARAAGYTVLAADGGGEVDLFAADDLLAGKVAWLFGNEAWGLPEDVAALADHRVAIPVLGRAESLNLATAAAVCLYASARAGGPST
ncbi:TrmH family RNA methyltransferase [Marmoricola sp. RAF53]|uniref:TrmH family RNA methyltransferase n=1 Tax=Marmoricola sp. RAF53 TaxID=3233059 RepID=UPI003F9E4D92